LIRAAATATGDTARRATSKVNERALPASLPFDRSCKPTSKGRDSRIIPELLITDAAVSGEPEMVNVVFAVPPSVAVLLLGENVQLIQQGDQSRRS
jgi:hypothetical protein